MKRIIIAIVFFSFLIITFFVIRRKEKTYEWYYVNDIIFNTDIKYYDNTIPPEILLRTKDGCSETKFKIKQEFYDAGNKVNDIITIENLNDLINYRSKFFELDYLDTFNEIFFTEYYLIFILQSYGTGVSYRNERIEINNRKYIFVNELWQADFPWAKACVDIDLFIIKIPKSIEIEN